MVNWQLKGGDRIGSDLGLNDKECADVAAELPDDC